MVKRPLPAELGLLAIDHIGVDADNDYHSKWAAEYLRTLCICALVCKEWTHRSRLYLFRSVYIQGKAQLDTLQTTFRRNPSFRDLVRAIHVTRLDLNRDKDVPVPLRLVLLLLRAMPPCVIKLGIYFDIPLDNITRRCLSLGYPHIVHLHLYYINAPINRVHHLVNAFPSLRTLSYSRDTGDGQVCFKYSIALGRHRSRLTVRIHVLIDCVIPG